MSSGFWHYLGSFMAYTLAVIGLIYAIFWYLKRNGLNGLTMGKKSIQSQQGQLPPLAIESVLSLEARKNLYVVRAGTERFLISTSLEGTQFLSRLENAPEQPETVPALEPISLETPPENISGQPPLAMSVLQQLWSRLKPAQTRRSGF